MAAQEGFADPEGRDKGAVPTRGELTAPAAAAEGRLRLAHLDGLRAVAALYVVMFHALPGFSAERLIGPWRVLRRAFAYGHEAVAVFIVLSGYCLMLPVLRRDPEQLSIAFGRFVRRRAFRILPPYFAALALTLALLAGVAQLRLRTGTIWDDSLPGLESGAVLSHLLLIHNWFPSYTVQINGPLWSVASEWQIYFFFPLCLLPAWRRLGMLGTLLLAALIGYAPLLLAPRSAATANPWYLLLFGMGMAAASINFAPSGLPRRLRAGLPWGSACAATWLACVGISNALAGWWFAHKPISDVLVGLATATLLVHLAERARRTTPPGALLAALQSAPVVGLGHFSYSLYLTHLPVLALCYIGLEPLALAPLPRALALLTLGSLCSLLVAYAFYLLVERRFMLER